MIYYLRSLAFVLCSISLLIVVAIVDMTAIASAEPFEHLPES